MLSKTCDEIDQQRATSRRAINREEGAHRIARWLETPDYPYHDAPNEAAAEQGHWLDRLAWPVFGQPLSADMRGAADAPWRPWEAASTSAVVRLLRAPPVAGPIDSIAERVRLLSILGSIARREILLEQGLASASPFPCYDARRVLIAAFLTIYPDWQRRRDAVIAFADFVRCPAPVFRVWLHRYRRHLHGADGFWARLVPDSATRAEETIMQMNRMMNAPRPTRADYIASALHGRVAQRLGGPMTSTDARRSRRSS